MAEQGFVVFKSDRQLGVKDFASQLLVGWQRAHSTHSVHPATLKETHMFSDFLTILIRELWVLGRNGIMMAVLLPRRSLMLATIWFDLQRKAAVPFLPSSESLRSAWVEKRNIGATLFR